MPTNYHAMSKRELAELAVSGDQQAALHLEVRNQEEDKAKAKERSARKATSEATIQRQITTALQAAGYLVIRVNSAVQSPDESRYLRCYHVANINASAGHADLVAYREGRAWFLEVKAAKGRQSESQQKFQDIARRYGMPYHIVRTPQEALDALRVGKGTLNR